MYTGFVVVAATAAVLAACTAPRSLPERPAGPPPSAFGTDATPPVPVLAGMAGTASVTADASPGVVPSPPPAQSATPEPGTPKASAFPPAAPARPAKPFASLRPRASAAHDAQALNEALTALAHHCDTAAHDLLADFLRGRPGARPLPLTAPKLRVEQGWKVYRSLPLLPLSVKQLAVREVSLLQLPDTRRSGLSIGFDAPLARARPVLEELQNGTRDRPELLVDGGRAVIYCSR